MNQRNVIITNVYKDVIGELTKQPLTVAEASKIIEAAGQYISNLSLPAEVAEEPKEEPKDNETKKRKTKR